MHHLLSFVALKLEISGCVNRYSPVIHLRVYDARFAVVRSLRLPIPPKQLVQAEVETRLLSRATGRDMFHRSHLHVVRGFRNVLVLLHRLYFGNRRTSEFHLMPDVRS